MNTRQYFKPVFLLAILLALPFTATAQLAHRDVMVEDDVFTPQVATIQTGGTVRWVDFQSLGNLHNVVSEDGLWTPSEPADGWTLTHRFNQPGTYNYYCEVHRDQGMVGTIEVVGEPVSENMDLNPGQNGNWWNGVARDGEGVQVELADAGDGELVFVATIYSYGPDSGQVFLIAVGTPNGDKVDVDVFITEGGFWGEAFNPDDVDQVQWGTGAFTSTDCSRLSMSLVPNADYMDAGYTTLEYDLERLTTPAVACPYEG